MSDSPLTIRCRENGPFVVEPPVRIIDHLGNEFIVPADKPKVALCRCGQSSTRPFCDGSHKRVGFVASEVAEMGGQLSAFSVQPE